MESLTSQGCRDDFKLERAAWKERLLALHVRVHAGDWSVVFIARSVREDYWDDRQARPESQARLARAHEENAIGASSRLCVIAFRCPPVPPC